VFSFSESKVMTEHLPPRTHESISGNEFGPKYVWTSACFTMSRILRDYTAKRSIGDISHRREDEERFWKFLPEIVHITFSPGL
jgi:hypothetical protein